MKAQPDTSVSLADTLRLSAAASDPDGDVLRYRLTKHVSWEDLTSGRVPAAEINGTTGAFWFAPKNHDRPSRTFTFHAEDGFGAADSTTFMVIVNRR